MVLAASEGYESLFSAACQCIQGPGLQTNKIPLTPMVESITALIPGSNMP